MSRPLLLLIAAALVTCLVAVPALLAGGDDDHAHAQADAHAGAAAHADDRGDDEGGGRFAWLRGLTFGIPAAAADPVDVGPALRGLDQALEQGIARCAPEVLDYDRALLEKVQPDWAPLKPNLRPSWAAWERFDGVVVDEAKVRACADAFAHADCAKLARRFHDCVRPFKGTRPAGAACETREQCASHTCFAGRCGPPDECKKAADCPSGMLCSPDVDENGASYNTCVEAPKDGGDCQDGAVGAARDPGDDPRCAAGDACDDDGHCWPAGREGDACGVRHPCAPSLYCADDDGDDHTCHKDEIVKESPDDGIDADGGCSCDPYRDGKACIDDGDEGMKCVPVDVVDKGQACDATHICKGSLGITACIEGTCRDALGVGDPCNDHDECKDDLICHDGACTPPGASGEPCTTSDDCVFGLECLPREPAPASDVHETAPADDLVCRVVLDAERPRHVDLDLSMPILAEPPGDVRHEVGELPQPQPPDP